MPQILNILGFTFFFYSREHAPIHVHIRGRGGEAKFELDPEIRLINFRNLKRNDLRMAERLVRRHRNFIMVSWQTYFNQN